MKFIGGPFDGRENNVQRDPGEIVDAPSRAQIDGRWYTISNFYEVNMNGVEATYQASQFEYKP